MSKNYEIWYDEDAGAIHLKVINMLTAQDVHEIMPASVKMFEKMERKYVIVDTSPEPSGMLEKTARRAFREYMESMKVVEKLAVYGAKPVPRMMARAAAAALGKLKVTRFFKTETEALAWLKEKK